MLLMATLTDSKKTIIYEIPGKIKKISLGSKMKYIDTIYNNKNFLLILRVTAFLHSINITQPKMVFV